MKIVIKFTLLIMLMSVAASAIFPQTSNATVRYKVYFVKDNAGFEEHIIAVERIRLKTPRVADAALRDLFKGPNLGEQKEALDSYYRPRDVIKYIEFCKPEKLLPLSEYYKGVSIKNGTAIVNFSPDAACYLQSTPAMAHVVLTPIELTLKQFKTVKRVEYALNGKIIVDWDA